MRSPGDAVTASLDSSRLAAFVASRQGISPSAVTLNVRPFRGGLEAAAVARAGARWTESTGRAGSLNFVAKRLEGSTQREADLYQLLSRSETEIAPQLLGIDQAVGASWDYEAELSDRAVLTLAVFEHAVLTPALMHLREYGPAVRRIVSELPKLRHALLNLQPFGKALLHGDVHS